MKRSEVIQAMLRTMPHRSNDRGLVVWIQTVFQNVYNDKEIMKAYDIIKEALKAELKKEEPNWLEKLRDGEPIQADRDDTFDDHPLEI